MAGAVRRDLRTWAVVLACVSVLASCGLVAGDGEAVAAGRAAAAAPRSSAAVGGTDGGEQEEPDGSDAADVAAASAAPTVDRSELVARLEAAAAAMPPEVAAGLVVLDPEGREVFAVDADRPLLPASTEKILTGAAAFHLFGPDRALTTTVDAVGTLREDGMLVGQLELVGAGDPALSEQDYRSHVYVGRPHTHLEELADAVVASGVREVTRGVHAAADPFGDTPEAPGWKAEYLAVLDARRITALTVNGGLAMTVVTQPPDLELELLAAEDPAAEAAEVLRRLLEERGVVVRDGPPLSAPEPRVEVGAVTGPTLAEHVRFAFERSDNHTADTLFRLLGVSGGATDWLGSGEVVAGYLADLGVDTDGMVMADGSGLSRDDRVTARQLAETDRILRNGPHGAAWREAMAIAGTEGTIRRRLRGTVAEGRFFAKSGTLDDVTAIVGTVETPDGAPAYHVAAIANVPPGAGRFPSKVVIDDVIALLAEDAAGCVRVATPEDVDPELLVPGQHVACP